MKTLRLRWILPLAHLAIDVLLALALIDDAHNSLRNRKVAHQRDQFLAVAYLQEDPPAIGFGRAAYKWVPTAFMLIIVGTPPVGIAVALIFPDAPFEEGKHAVDPRWFTLHEALAVTLWSVVGWQIERRGT